jgi:hypothetical protein
LIGKYFRKRYFEDRERDGRKILRSDLREWFVRMEDEWNWFNDELTNSMELSSS